MPRGASPKREREYKELKSEFKKEGRYKGREEEVASRIVNKQRSQYGETKGEKKKDRQGKSPDRDLPIKNYQHKTVGQVERAVAKLSGDDLKEIEKYEKQHKNRKTLLEAISAQRKGGGSKGGSSSSKKSGASSKKSSSSSKSGSSKTSSSKAGSSTKSSSRSKKSSSSGSSTKSSSKSKSSSKKSSGGKSSRSGSKSSSSDHGGNVTTDHDEIRQWVEERGGKPSAVIRTESDDDVGIIRLDFPGYSGAGALEEISWDDWFAKFEESKLAFLHQDETAGGKKSNFNKLISR